MKVYLIRTETLLNFITDILQLSWMSSPSNRIVWKVHSEPLHRGVVCTIYQLQRCVNLDPGQSTLTLVSHREALKKIIGEAEEAAMALARKDDGITAMMATASIAITSDVMKTVQARPPSFSGDQEEMPPSPESRPDDEWNPAVPEPLQSAKTRFFFQLERELDKVNVFYLQKETELKVRFRSLLDKKKVILSRGGKRYGSVTSASLKDAFTQYQEDLTRLQVGNSNQLLFHDCLPLKWNPSPAELCGNECNGISKDSQEIRYVFTDVYVSRITVHDRQAIKVTDKGTLYLETSGDTTVLQ